jgi:hypothetical protein
MTTQRDDAVRSLLVATANRPAPRPWRTTAIIASITFLLGGGVAVGALSAAAATRVGSPEVSVPQGMFSMFLRGGHTTGSIVSYPGSGSTSIDLGPRPADATGIADYIQCEGAGNFTQTAGGEVGLQQECAIGTGIGFSSDNNPTDSIVSLKADSGLKYTIWAQWIFVPGPSEASIAQKAALADGVVSDTEYRAAVDRFSACMLGAGYPLTDVQCTPDLSWSNASKASETGVVDRCEDAELSQVLKIWQSQR